MFELVRDSGAEVLIHDSFVTYWEEQSIEVETELAALLDSYPDLIILSAGHSEYKTKSTINKIMAMKPTFIYDTIGLFNNEQLHLLGTKHRVSVLGRGDL